jgi:hypothetical protein
MAGRNSKSRQARPASKRLSLLAEIERERDRRPAAEVLREDQDLFDRGFLAERRAAELLLKHIDKYDAKPVRAIARKYPWLLFHLPELVRSTQKAAAISRMTDSRVRSAPSSRYGAAASLPDATGAGARRNARSKIPLATFRDDDGKRINWQDDESSAMKSAPISGLKRRLLRIRRKIEKGAPNRHLGSTST